MKNLLYILLFVPLALFGQNEDPCYSINDYNLLTQEANPLITKDFVQGWNMFGYPCSENIDVIVAFISIEDEIDIVKDNNGSVYMPEFGFNGIGLLEGGEGYQIKMNSTVYNFSFCESIYFPSIEGCTDCESSNFDNLATIDDGSCNILLEIVGCGDSIALNYNSNVSIFDYSCVYPEHTTSQCIHFKEGVQVWSTYLDVNGSFVDAFSEIQEYITIMKNSLGFIYWPEIGYNGIGELIPGQAYEIYMDSAAVVCLEGEQYQVIGTLNEGENWIAYNKTYPTKIDESFSNLPSLIYVIGPGGNFYSPGLGGINEIGLLLPGEGYMVVTNDVTTDYSYSPVSAYSCDLCEGCIISFADNFNPLATIDDGSCIMSPYVSDSVPNNGMDVIFLNQAFEDAGLMLYGWLVAYDINDLGEEIAISSSQWSGTSFSLNLIGDSIILKYITDDNTYLINGVASSPNSPFLSGIQVDSNSYLVVGQFSIE